MILLIDNAGSFTHSLVRMLTQAGEKVQIVSPETAQKSDVQNADAVIISTGPDEEQLRKINIEAIRDIDSQMPLLGIGLGMRVLLEADGAQFVAAGMPEIGATDEVIHDEAGLFEGVPSPLVVGRYDAMMLDEDTLPNGWSVSAHTLDGAVLGVRRDNSRHVGIMFQPTSVLTQRGSDIIANFIESIPAD